MATLNYTKPDLNTYAQQVGEILRDIRPYPVVEVGMGSFPSTSFWLMDVILGEVAPVVGGGARNWHDLVVSVPIFLARGKQNTKDFPAVRRAINDDVVDLYLQFLFRDDLKTTAFPTMQRGFLPTSIKPGAARLQVYMLDNVSYIGAEMTFTFYHRVVAT